MKTPLTPEESAQVFDLVSGAAALEPAQQAAFLARACAGSDRVREEAESLLGFKNRLPLFMASPAFDQGLELLGSKAGDDFEPGDILGDYRIVRLIGVGGMSEVYLADDTVHGRQVALKLTGAGRAEDGRGRYFRHERRVLAALNHPHIARLYGSGITLRERTYLVMEYVEGERLDRYCEERGLDVPARLALFRKVCAAVSYAHQNLVVHRDLKPANIRVTPEGEPKLLDFGIAKLLDPEGALPRLDPTMTLQGAMTPEYASPEQIKGEPITTASDVYSLGVVLFELLTGQRPYAHLKGCRPDELARAICEQEPPAPSTVAGRTPSTATTASAGKMPVGGEPSARLRRQLAGDLDNIVAKALRKEPGRRYPAVSAFSEDLRRHCDGLPVMARKDTLRYRAGKFVRRHKAGVAAGVLVIFALVAGLVVATWQARVALRERDRAHLAQRQAERLNGFLEELLGSADQSHSGKDVKVSQVLDAAGKNLDRELAGEPALLAQAHQTLFRSYFNLGLFGPAEQHARAAFDLERQLRGAEDPATARAEIDLAKILCERVHQDQAAPLLRHALVVLRRQPVPDEAALAEALRTLSYAFYLRGQPDRAEPLVTEALTHARAAWGEQSSNYARVLNTLGAVISGKRDDAAAEVIYRRLLALQDQLAPGGEHSITPLTNLCVCLCNLEKWAEMRPMVDRLARDARRLYGEKGVYYALAIYGQGVLDASEGHPETAVPRFREALPLLAAAFAPGAPGLVQCRVQLGLCLTRTGQAAEGEGLLRTALADGGKIDRAEFAHTFGNLEIALGECLLAQRPNAESERLLLTGHEDLEKRLGARNRFTVLARRLLRRLYLDGNRPAEAARFDDGGAVQAASTP